MESNFFITSFNKRLYDDYAHSFIETYVKTNQTINKKIFEIPKRNMN